jgi:PAS domain-containing protein
MAVSEADYLDVLDLILEAALQPAAWDRVLRRLARLTDCVAGGLTIENPGTGEGTPITYFGFDKNHVEKTFDHYLPMNPLHRIAPLMKPGLIVTNSDVIPLDVFQRTEFYNGWARPQQVCCPLTLVLHRSDEVYCPLTLARPDGAGDATVADRALLERLAPHLIRAMGVSLRLGFASHQRVAMEQTLMGLATAVLLLDWQKRIVFANPAAEKLLAAAEALLAVDGLLAARAVRSNHQLQKAILEVMGRKPVADAEISIEREDGRPLLATVLPLVPENPFLPLLTHLACCAVFVSDPDACPSGAVARRRAQLWADSC